MLSMILSKVDNHVTVSWQALEPFANRVRDVLKTVR